MVQINFTKEAFNDIDEIAIYIAKDSPKFSELTISKIILRTEILRDYPLSGKPVREYKRSKLREIIEGNYRIIYKIVSTNRIDILAIHHSARSIKKRKLK